MWVVTVVLNSTGLVYDHDNVWLSVVKDTIIGGEVAKELKSQDTGWVIHVDFENTKNDGRAGDGKKSKNSCFFFFFFFF